MRNNLPKKCKKNECGVINLDSTEGPGTHWLSYYKIGKECNYFDSFGDLQPFEEFKKYIGANCNIYFNYDREQNYNSIKCGHLCLKFLFQMSNERKMK